VAVIANLTPYDAESVIGRDARGVLSFFLTVKATYVWDRDGTAKLTEPAPILTEDQLLGEGNAAVLAAGSEVGPPKPRVDVLLSGALVFPTPIDEIDVTLQVGTRIAKIVRVFGDRTWQPSLTGDLVPSRPKPVTRVPIDWRLAFGGTDPEDPSQQDPRNPAGTGVAKSPDSLIGRPAPTFEDPKRLVQSWKSRPAPQGFGPVASHWQPRVKLAGTYDERWRKDRWPLLPDDFAPAFFNVAPVDQQLPDYWPEEEVVLTYMSEAGHDRFRLPALSVPVLFAASDALTETSTAVDTLVIEPEARRFSLVARASCPLHPDHPVVDEAVIGSPTAAHRRALERGKRYTRRTRKTDLTA
jgi:hypothetical protein